MNMLKLALIDKRRLCVTWTDQVFTPLRYGKFTISVIIFIWSGKRSGGLLWRYGKPLRHGVNTIVISVVIF